MNPLRIIFMGTPGFAVASLRILVENGLNIVAVVTAMDKPAGRGLQVSEPAVKKYAVEKGIPVLQPAKLKDPEFIRQLKSFNADLQVVVAFRMLPEIVWNMPPLGTINLHASLLPDYRGAAPINHAIINGEKFTGVTTFRLKHEIDTGDVLLQEVVEIGENDNAGSLHDKLMIIGAQVLLKTVRMISEGNYATIPQTTTSSKTAPRIHKEDCAIDWDQDAETIWNFIRGLSPYPGAYTLLDGKLIKIYDVHIEKKEHDTVCGSHESDNKSYLRFCCRNGWVYINELQLEGKKRMQIGEFLRGYKIKTT